ncbi:hypothetical protein QYF36_019288 [Acer negundo]|nr:hypothetical protein QYF36_019288 [Acer negundo]
MCNACCQAMRFGDGYNPALCVMLVFKQCVVMITAATDIVKAGRHSQTGTVYPHYSPYPAFVFTSSVKATHTTATINLDCHSYRPIALPSTQAFHILISSKGPVSLSV